MGSQLNARDFIAQDGTPDEVFLREESRSEITLPDERTENISSRSNPDETNLLHRKDSSIPVPTLPVFNTEQELMLKKNDDLSLDSTM